MSYLEFIEQTAEPSRKHKIWGVWSKNGGAKLGGIRWFSPWRRYVFYPNGPEVLFDANCLVDIANFLNGEMGKRQ